MNPTEGYEEIGAKEAVQSERSREETSISLKRKTKGLLEKTVYMKRGGPRNWVIDSPDLK